MCPKADDPVTTDQFNRKIGLIITSETKLQGTLGIKLFGSTSYISLTSPSNINCKNGMELSNQIESVICNYTVITNKHHNIEVTFTAWPTINVPDNNIYSNNGNPNINDFFCDASGSNSTGLLCTFYDIISQNIKGIN